MFTLKLSAHRPGQSLVSLVCVGVELDICAIGPVFSASVDIAVRAMQSEIIICGGMVLFTAAKPRRCAGAFGWVCLFCVRAGHIRSAVGDGFETSWKYHRCGLRAM